MGYNTLRLCPGLQVAGASICIPNFPSLGRYGRKSRGEEKTGEKKMKYAIVESGGKQYRAVEGSKIEVDRLAIEAGQPVVINSVLLLVDEGSITVGTPTVSGAVVTTKVVDHFKGPKVVIFKYSPKKRIRVKTGHRQQYTRLQVESITVE
jgi:large subunit ribosomal protein L21